MIKPILYVNGDSHSAGAEAANPCAFAEDDPEFEHLGRKPHPANAKVAWPTLLAKKLGYELVLDAESASSNARIIRTTKNWIGTNQSNLDRVVIVIQWSGWEREEWLDQDGTYYQVNASGLDHVPAHWHDRYREFVVNVDWNKATKFWHDAIYQFHSELKNQNIKHVFFNGHSTFSNIRDQYQWHGRYLWPYSLDHSYNSLLKSNGFEYVNPKTYHFGADAHCFWAEFMLHCLTDNNWVE